MRNHCAARFLIIFILLMTLNNAVAPGALAAVDDPWWHEDWPYRVPINLDGAGVAAVNLNFSQLFADLGLVDALLDLHSVRVIPYQDGIPGEPIPYQETYSRHFNDADSLNLNSESALPYWFGEGDTNLSLDTSRHTQGTGAIHTHTRIRSTSSSDTGFSYHFNGDDWLDWSGYETLLVDILPEVNASAVDQTPDLFYLELGGLTNCPIRKISGPALAMNVWNSATVSLKPFGNCLSPGLSALDYVRFFVRVNREWDNLGYFDPGDEVQFWLDNFRLVDQDGIGEIRWQAESGIDRYYIYFDTLNHAGHPLPALTTTAEPTLTATAGVPEAGGYFSRITGSSNGNLNIWQAPITEKILPSYKAPVSSQPLTLHAARGEFEAVQVVVQSPTTRNLPVSVSPFVHSNGKTILSPEQINLFRVDTVQMTQLSDYYGRITAMPDPLYPISNGQSVRFPKGKNQSLWIRIEVPNNTLPGWYSGQISIGNATVPVSLEVWHFFLPEVSPMESQFGFDWDLVLETYGGTHNGVPQPCYDQLVEAIEQTFANYLLSPAPPDDPGLGEDVLIYSLTAYEVEKSHTLQIQSKKKVWWEFVSFDHPPLANPAVIDRPGTDARILPWLAWLDRVDGLYYLQTTDWDDNPWERPFSNGLSNGNGYFFYPPNDATLGYDPCSPESNRLVPSIRLELLREGMEDYAYLWLLNLGKPIIGEDNPADLLAQSIIQSRTAYSRIPTAFDALRIEIAGLIPEPDPLLHYYLPVFVK